MSQLATGAWTRSRRCDAGNCVEARLVDARVAVRDTTEPEVALAVDRASWLALLDGVRGDRLG